MNQKIKTTGFIFNTIYVKLEMDNPELKPTCRTGAREEKESRKFFLFHTNNRKVLYSDKGHDAAVV